MLFIVQDYTENANRDVPLIVENVWYSYFVWGQGPHMFFFYKIYFYSMTIM